MTSIDEEAFEDCINLTTVILPQSLTSLGYLAFAYCTQLAEVYCYAESIPNIEADSSPFYAIQTNNITLHVPSNAIEAYKTTWPWSDFNPIVALGSTPDDDYSTISGKCGDNVRYAYNKDSKILTISGKGMMYDYAYNNTPWSLYSDEILSVNIEEGVTSIGNRAFMNFRSLTSFDIPNSVTTIGEYALAGYSKLETLTIGKNVKFIDQHAFSMWGTNLSDIFCYAVEPPAAPKAFDDEDDYFLLKEVLRPILHVPSGSIEAYKKSHPWGSCQIKPLSESGEESDYKSLLIGKWELIERKGNVHTHLEFKEDGTFSYTSTDWINYEEHGNFKVEGDILYQWFSDENEWSPSKIVSVDNENLSLLELLDDGITPLGSVNNYRKVSGSSSILIYRSRD